MAIKREKSRALSEPIAALDWVRMLKWPRRPSSGHPLTLVDLFCSCGGMTLGAWEGARITKRNLDVRLAVDLKAEPLNVYKANFGRIASDILRADICEVFDGKKDHQQTDVEKKWKQKIGPLDLLVAGPPCQGHSDLNNSTRRDDPRNALYLTVIRAAEVLAPKAVIIENVPAVQLDRGNVVAMAQNKLAQLGYSVSSDVVQLSHFGVPQNRKRHVLIASKGDRFAISDAPQMFKQPPTAGAYLSGLEDSANTNGLMSTPATMTQANKDRVRYLFDNDLDNLPNSLRPPCHKDKEHAYISMYGRIRWGAPAQTLTSGFGSMGQGRYVHPTRQRLITPREAARLQGFPDFFDFNPATTLSGLREMIANAVPPQFTAVVVANLIRKGIC